MLDRNDIVHLLNGDIEGEHAAIIQYLTNAYAMGEGEMACEIEAIAREEMRHLDWLSEAVVDLGGIPSVERGEMRLGGATVADWMRDDVLQEEDAIGLYQEHIDAIDDRKITRLLERIKSDEEAHRLAFQGSIDKAGREGARDLRGARSDGIVQRMNWGIEHEYTVVLQYMLHSYLARDMESKRLLEDRAINEMQHLAWLSERVVGMGGTPSINHTPVDRSTELADMAQANLDLETEVSDVYAQAAAEVDDVDLKRLFRRMQGHEDYHAEIFRDMLADGESPG